ncbi:MAG: hypothetical protein PHR96_02320 [Clostridia bacterium]|nr:hypothetical protein [Clostridia bacterium]
MLSPFGSLDRLLSPFDCCLARLARLTACLARLTVALSVWLASPLA